MPLKPTDRFTYSRNGGGNRDERCAIRVNIPGVETDAERASTRYKIDVTNVQTRQTWQTTHRYSEFLALRNELLAHFAKAERKCPGCVNFEKVIRLFEFPSKRYFTSKNAVVINYRKTALRAFLELLTSHTFTTSPKCPTCSGLPFTAVRDFLTDEPATASQSSASPTSSLDGDLLDARESVRESVRDTIQVKNFTTYVAPPKSAPVSSDGVFVRQKSKQSSKRDNKADMPPSAMKAQPKPAKQPSQKQSAQDLPAPPASSKAVASLPASPTRADAEQARRDEAASFVSFSGASETKSSAPMASSPRRAATPKTSGKKKNKRGSSRQSLESEGSVKESQDDEFGSLNMDFLQSVSVAKE